MALDGALTYMPKAALVCMYFFFPSLPPETKAETNKGEALLLMRGSGPHVKQGEAFVLMLGSQVHTLNKQMKGRHEGLLLMQGCWAIRSTL